MAWNATLQPLETVIAWNRLAQLSPQGTMMKGTTGYPAPSPLLDKYKDRMAKEKWVVPHLPNCEERFDMDWSIPHPSSWFQATLGQPHSSPGSQPKATTIQRHLPAMLAPMHTNSHASLMGSACRTLAGVSVILAFSPSAYGNLIWEGSISFQPTLPPSHTQTLSSTAAAVTSLS